MRPLMKGRGGATAVRVDDLAAVIAECGPNTDRLIRTNTVRAMGLRMTARPAIKTGKGKPAKPKSSGIGAMQRCAAGRNILSMRLMWD